MKLNYQSPRLEDHGTINQITLAVVSTGISLPNDYTAPTAPSVPDGPPEL